MIAPTAANPTAPVVWIVDDDGSVRWVLEKALQGEGISTRSFDNAEALLKAFDTAAPDVLMTDIRMPGMDGIEMMRRLESDGHVVPVIVMTAHADLDSAVSAYQGGAFEYLPKPFDIDEAVALVNRAARAIEAVVPPVAAEAPAIAAMIGQAPAMQEVFRTIGRLSRSSMNVLITGESGTGKELVARALHEHSPRGRQAFVALNTTAIASELLESELFGHERGAFTGAERQRIGRFEQADHGTLFLDEIGDMSPALQTRLLRVLAESEFYRVGGQAAIRVDVRVIAATNQDLVAAVAAGRFREDLFHRLNVIRICTPPLRHRREDVPQLLRHYLKEAAKELGSEPKTLTDDATERLRSCDWPGNVRQLVNACRRLSVTAPGAEIRVADIPDDLGGQALPNAGKPAWVSDLVRWAEQQLEVAGRTPGGASTALLQAALPEFERALIRVALARAKGRKQAAAKMLGWGRNTLTRKIRELGIDD
ncbi:MAG: nitrogen regulation protein NR(I) [Gammaproteobacteria bacterium]|nr:MAG: nitrogen regulation protein NR(I) [Gammaproteobacteria bacterium]